MAGETHALTLHSLHFPPFLWLHNATEVDTVWGCSLWTKQLGKQSCVTMNVRWELPKSSTELNSSTQTWACASCANAEELCTCRCCARCSQAIPTPRSRHRCKRCRCIMCLACLTKVRYVDILAIPQPVCSECAVPRGLALLNERRGALLWGLYALWGATDAPAMCVTPSCGAYTYAPFCRTCGLPTVATGAHTQRSVRANGRAFFGIRKKVNLLEMREYCDRESTVGSYSEVIVEKIFRSCFPRGEEVSAFPSLGSATGARDLLMSLVAAGIAYEYKHAPSITLSLSDFPFASLMRVVHHYSRFTVLEASGKVKLISFPGAHDSRTAAISMRFAQVIRCGWAVQDVAGSGDDMGNRDDKEGRAACYSALQYSVHGGFVHEAEEVIPEIQRIVEDALKHGYRLVLSGHSLGGAVAALVTLRLLHTNPDLPEHKLKCFTFGAPLVGDDQLTKLVKEFGLSTRFQHVVHLCDIIPQLLCTGKWPFDHKNILHRGRALVQGVLRRGVAWLTGCGEDPGAGSTAVTQLASNGQGEEKIHSHDVEVSRSFACFGCYHFISCDGVRYISIQDADEAYNVLKSASIDQSGIRYHGISAYNRAIFFHIYTSGCVPPPDRSESITLSTGTNQA
ncbi:unnamed protein product [Trypanosoma congolense IL3000]|uniref:WGS project CAEQ00000000 data, annotated contig 1358 n=1 Tax=Trypanosoma congolense (strain IL3000) TaxID=1068625 RepID=F9W5Q2_TRYCI|nr:unnamed protein product [Trypanosoma congolense IL3000]